MKIDVLTLFPEIIDSYLQQGVVGQACKNKTLSVTSHSLRAWAEDLHKTVDDRPFGGGDGMVLLPTVLQQAMRSIVTDSHKKVKKVYLSPQGRPWSAALAKQWASECEHIVLVCGRYAGTDQRWLNSEIDEEISIGDYVVSGGELPALVLIDSMARWLPGVLGHKDSAACDSFTSGLLEAPLYTRPQEWQNLTPPDVLLSGHHKKIADYRHKISWLVTAQKRKDIFLKQLQSEPVESRHQIKQNLFSFLQDLSEAEKKQWGLNPSYVFWKALLLKPQVAVALIHYPILDRQKNIVATNVTNFDIHDIARACRTYGVDKYYIIHPMQEQLMFVSRVLDHWRTGRGARFNPMRQTALGPVHPMETLDQALLDWQSFTGQKSWVMATHARSVPNVPTQSFLQVREVIEEGSPLFLLFGTGFGLTSEMMQNCDAVIESIAGASLDNYRHLSVRSAVSICLDRLLST